MSNKVKLRDPTRKIQRKNSIRLSRKVMQLFYKRQQEQLDKLAAEKEVSDV